jgi:predicted nucleic acid-binding protein
LILVDTSAWIDFFRGRAPLAAVVDGLLAENEVALCGPVITELRRGLRSARERTIVMDLLEGCHLLAQPQELWEEAGELGALLGRRGATVKSMDLLIATYALAHSVPVLTLGSDFAAIQRSGVGLALARPR